MSNAPINGTRPRRLSSEHEAKLNEGDKARSDCNIQLEAVTERLREVADELTASEDDGIPIVIDTEDDQSLVTSIDSVRALVR